MAQPLCGLSWHFIPGPHHRDGGQGLRGLSARDPQGTLERPGWKPPREDLSPKGHPMLGTHPVPREWPQI